MDIQAAFDEAFRRSTVPAPRRQPILGLLGLIGLSVVAGILAGSLATPLVSATSAVTSRAINLFESLPEKLDPSQPMLPSTIYVTGADGAPVEFAKFYEQNRIPVTYEQVAPVLYDAIVSSEDPRFWTHAGVDIIGTSRAIVSNALGSAQKQGGSTIVQQYVKNVHVQECESTAESDEELQQCWVEATDSEGAGGIARKLQEMRYSIALSKEVSKKDILVGYLNLANFGGITYGIEAAAQRYFGVSSADLTLAQAASIAGMVQNPNSFRLDMPDSETNGAANGYAQTKQRQSYVLSRMLADGKITQAQYEETVAAPIEPHIQPGAQGCAEAGAGAYFCQYVVNEVKMNTAFGATPEERAHALRRGGMDIYTTLDMRVQGPSEQAMSEYVPAHLPGMDLGAAGVSIESHTGRILSVVQNTKFSEDQALTDSDPAYNSMVYAADFDHGASSGFSVGSTYKLFTLIDWLEKGHTITEKVNGSNRIFKNFTCDGRSVPNSTFIRNFGGTRGYPGTPIAFTSASLNSGFLAMAEKLDLCDINRAAERMGVHLGTMDSVTDSNLPYETVLGSRNIAPLQMAPAYATVANGGSYCEPRAIDKVVLADGSELTLDAPGCVQVITPEVSAAAARALESVMTTGTARQTNAWDGVPVIGKTGTHENLQTMMVQSSTNATSVVWVGNASGFTDLYNTYANGREISTLRHPLSKAMQAAANAVYGGERFPEPPRKMVETPDVTIPNVVGMSESDAMSTLEGAGLVAVKSHLPGQEQSGTVISMDPGPSARVAPGSPVNIYISTGAAKSENMPNVTGRSSIGAESYLASRGFVNVQGCDDGGVVSSTTPQAGSTVEKDNHIALHCD